MKLPPIFLGVALVLGIFIAAGVAASTDVADVKTSAREGVISGLWKRIIKKLETRLEKSLEIGEKMKSESLQVREKLEEFQKRVGGVLKKLNNDPEVE